MGAKPELRLLHNDVLESLGFIIAATVSSMKFFNKGNRLL